MADNGKYSSADKNISIGRAKADGGKLNPKAILGSMSKDVRQRWMLVGGVLSGAVLFATVALSSNNTPHKAQPVDAVIDTTPKGISSEKNWKTTTDAEMLAMKQELTQTRKSQQEVIAHLDSMRRELQLARNNPGASQNNARAGVDLSIPAPPVPPSSLMPPPPPPIKQGAAAPVAPAPSRAAAAPSTMPTAVAPTEYRAEPPARSPARAFSATSSAASDAAAGGTEENQMVANDHEGFLPAGSFADATMISGVEAFTGGTAQAQPQPVVVRVDQNAVLPNAARYQIKGCHVLASVYGDMSAERVYGRLTTLTCVDVRNKLVLSEDVKGVLVDSDGKNGIRGTLEDRQGAKLARSLLAGFAQGVSQAFGQSQSTFQTTALGTTSTLVGANALRAGGYQGASTAAQQIAEFYLKQAESTMPVIAVDAGRRINVLFTESKSLHFEATGLYKPKKEAKVTVESSY